MTGGPGGGKTTAVDLFQREFRKRGSVVPEAATMLFMGGVRRGGGIESAAATQEPIYRLLCSLVLVFATQNPDLTLACDRGTLDGVAYWPESEEAFFDRMESSYEREMSRYGAVIFFETGAGSNGDITSNNPVRNESNREAIEFDRRLQGVWSRHPDYHFVHSSDSFLEKIKRGVDALTDALQG